MVDLYMQLQSMVSASLKSYVEKESRMSLILYKFNVGYIKFDQGSSITFSLEPMKLNCACELQIVSFESERMRKINDPAGG